MAEPAAENMERCVNLQTLQYMLAAEDNPMDLVQLFTARAVAWNVVKDRFDLQDPTRYPPEPPHKI